jgi:hypothetical protein
MTHFSPVYLSLTRCALRCYKGFELVEAVEQAHAQIQMLET